MNRTSKKKKNSPLLYSRASVIDLAKRGPKVIYVTDLTMENLEALAKEVETTYPNVKCIPRAVDAASTKDVTGIIDDAINTYGRLDVFFANAGVATGDSIHQEDAESFMRMMRINALSAFLACKYAGAAMKKLGGGKQVSGGSVICTASVAGIRSGAGSPEYSASKAA